MKSQKVHAHEVRDEKGRRRFHGAFTGGFSAGYFNTVSTEKGWAPSQFVSSRSSRADVRQQKPEDYMDDHDGILGMKLTVSDRFDSTCQEQKRVLSEESRKESGRSLIPGSVPLEMFSWNPTAVSAGRRLLMKLSSRPPSNAVELPNSKNDLFGLGLMTSSRGNEIISDSSSRYYMTDLLNNRFSGSSSSSVPSGKSFGFEKKQDDDDDDNVYKSGLRDFDAIAYDDDDVKKDEDDNMPSLIEGFSLVGQLSSNLPPIPNLSSSSSSSSSRHIFPSSSASSTSTTAGSGLEIPSLSSRFTNKSMPMKKTFSNEDEPIMKRTVKSWVPVSLLSKRCNVPPISSSSSVMDQMTGESNNDKIAEDWMMETYNQVFSTELTDLNHLKEVYNCPLVIDVVRRRPVSPIIRVDSQIVDDVDRQGRRSKHRHHHHKRRRSSSSRRRR